MMYRNLKPEETTIQKGDVGAREFHPTAVGEPVRTVIGGTTFVLRPIPDEPEDVVRIEGEVCAVLRSRGVIDQLNVTLARTPVPLDVTLNQCVTLLIPRPEPPVPKCPYCGIEMDIKRNDAGYWAQCSHSNCSAVVRGKPSPSRRAAIEAMTPKGGGQ